jgi:hypothetical protein
VSERLQGGKRGVQGGGAPRAGVRGQRPRNFFFWADIFSSVSGRHIIVGPTYFWDDIFLGPHDIRWFSAHGFCRWFSISG